MTALDDLRETLHQAASRTPHGASERNIVAVSKRHPASSIEALADKGHRDFGENYAGELECKAEELKGRNLHWHFIGSLQRNKVKKVVGIAALIHAVDSERLLVAINKRATSLGVVQEILIAVSLAGEEQKSGVLASECATLVAAAAALENVSCVGLMTMPPLASDAEANRPYFAELRALRDTLRDLHPSVRELSMGTSGDCVVAAEEGATIVRVGTTLFGPRPS